MGSWPIFPLSLSSSGWNMKPGPLQPSLSPGLPVLPAPTLLCITQLHLASSSVLKTVLTLWQETFLHFFFFRTTHIHHFIHLSHWPGFGFLQCLFFKRIFTCKWILNYPKLLYRNHSHWEKASTRLAVWLVIWAPNKRDVEASPASFLLSLLHLSPPPPPLYLTVSGM